MHIWTVVSDMLVADTCTGKCELLKHLRVVSWQTTARIEVIVGNEASMVTEERV